MSTPPISFNASCIPSKNRSKSHKNATKQRRFAKYHTLHVLISVKQPPFIQLQAEALCLEAQSLEEVLYAASLLLGLGSLVEISFLEDLLDLLPDLMPLVNVQGLLVNKLLKIEVHRVAVVVFATVCACFEFTTKQ